MNKNIFLKVYRKRIKNDLKQIFSCVCIYIYLKIWINTGKWLYVYY